MRKFRPGQRVRKSGIYRVLHESHRLMHEAALLEGGKFPRCNTCGPEVRFELARSIVHRAILPFRSGAILEEFPSLQEMPPKAEGA